MKLYKLVKVISKRYVKVKRSLIPSWSTLHLCWSSLCTPWRFMSMESYSCR